MDKNTEYIDGFIQKCIGSNKILFDKKEIAGIPVLKALGVIDKAKDAPDKYELNPSSTSFNAQLLVIAEELLGRKTPGTLVAAFKFVEDFQEKLKEENGIASNVINAYNKLISALKAYTLYHLTATGFDVKSYYLDELRPRGDRENELFLFERSLYDFLPFSGYSAQDVWDICQKTLFSDDPFYVRDFAIRLPAVNFELAEEIYNLACEFEQPEKTSFVANLLIGLHNNGLKGVFNTALRLHKKHPRQGYQVLSSLKNLTTKQNQILFRHLKKDSSDNVIAAKTQVLCALINNPSVGKKLRKDAFDMMGSYLQLENRNIVMASFNTLIYALPGHEEEKYGLLQVYLNNTSDFTILDSFFYRFDNPDYLFHFIKMCYTAGWVRGSIQRFENAIFHFWDKDPSKTEQIILDLFHPNKKLGMLPVEIIMTGRFAALPVDLLKLKTKQEQAKAVEAITLYPHSYDRWLPMVMSLRNSPYPRVVKFLQVKLANLISEAYSGSFLDDIQNLLVKSKFDREFAKPLKAAQISYEKKIVAKRAVKDLNPYENERDLMNLYYGLERENRTRSINDTNENPKGFLSAARQVIIVRGNSWKRELDNKVDPLGKVETSLTLDARLFKNPELHEFTLNTYDKK